MNLTAAFSNRHADDGHSISWKRITSTSQQWNDGAADVKPLPAVILQTRQAVGKDFH